MSKPFKITPKVKVDGSIDNGAWETIRRAISNHAGKFVTITVAEPKRTTSWNAFYWGYIIKPIADAMQDAGVPLEEVFKTYDDRAHTLCKSAILGKQVIDFDGEEIHVIRSTTTLTRSESYEYSTKCTLLPFVKMMNPTFIDKQAVERATGTKVRGYRIEDID